MDKKKVALYLVVVIVFGLSFTILNKKYDRFYRINGINNENRSLIEEHLSKEEQVYLVENSFPMDRFLKYLQYDIFSLFNLEYYESMEQNKEFENTYDLIFYTNEIINKLESQNQNVKVMFTRLITDEFHNEYLHHPDFNIDHIQYYEMVKKAHGNISYIEFTQMESVLKKMSDLEEFKDVSTKDALIKQWLDYHYQVTDIESYLNAKKENAELLLLEHPDSLTSIVDSTHTISTYVPNDLVILNDMLRPDFLMYIRSVAYNDLLKMQEGIGVNNLYITQSYRSYEYLNEHHLNGGTNEYQLGLSVDFQLEEDDQTYNWLIENSWEYGFVLRYPKEKKEITNHVFSPTTFRYVGKDVSKEMHESNLCLEEYISQKEGGQDEQE